MDKSVDMPVQAEIAEKIRAMGQTFTPEVLTATYDLFEPLQQRAPKDGVERVDDVAYGPDERHRLDIFKPAGGAGGPAPVVAYFHGGGFVGGERSPLPGLIYDNVPTFFARHGMIGVNATYRLAPEHKYPGGAADVGAAIGWLAENVAEHGGDPARIFAMGQSAGASHVAAYSFIEEVHGKGGPGNAGAILLSGSYAPLDPEYSNGKPAANQIAYYGEDLDKWEARSPLNHVREGHPPVFLAVAELDPYPLAWPTAALAGRLVKMDRRMPPMRRLTGHNHVSPAMQINSEVDALGPELLDFIKDCG
jgi:triacylglycerol lipase